ncbi:DNA-directed RNA polymerases I, II, and III subunit RPABC3 [Cytospora mali]|uniref:DNA-directed RNA polymerases I, II, and III subunit RPABC3 n=1 Tax=Cytospora mali TaxID=578113 RepID=A0A194VYK5_CYTMA|nr:DNA-directed RNA polymerases I, II, and III subunit RPABC3 [Valsa mali]
MAEASSDALLFEDQFTVSAIDHKKYDRAARITASSLDGATSLELDINTELLPLSAGDNVEVALATTLNLDGSREDEKTWRDVAKPGVNTLADAYHYVCYGKVYKFEDGKAEKTLKAYTSFGGLLMALEGPDSKLTPLRVDHVYLLIRK